MRCLHSFSSLFNIDFISQLTSAMDKTLLLLATVYRIAWFSHL